MKFVNEFHDPSSIALRMEALCRYDDRQYTLMEVCGGQTHAILRHGIDRMLPAHIELIHGPGCPVCVTPIEYIDKALQLASQPGVMLCTFGDMLRVPGSHLDLLAVKAQGADIRAVYSPLDAVKLAAVHPDREVVFFAVGFETTAPAVALAAVQALGQKRDNFSLLVSHVRVPPAIKALLDADFNRVQGFLAAGHVCAVMGYTEYESLAQNYQVPIVVTGFEPLDIVNGLLKCVQQLHEGRCEVENEYRRAVRREGNPTALRLMDEVFVTVDRDWRGLGRIPNSGLGLSPAYQVLDAEKRYGLVTCTDSITTECQSGHVLTGRIKPVQCPAFATRCTPERPLGATMVSSEGACAAYYHYQHEPGLHGLV
ncbi:MAG: hydrogenase formation protein HypD [Methylococcaceae bacterium]